MSSLRPHTLVAHGATYTSSVSVTAGSSAASCSAGIQVSGERRHTDGIETQGATYTPHTLVAHGAHIHSAASCSAGIQVSGERRHTDELPCQYVYIPLYQ
jgi:hypothetical protein